MSVGYAEYVIPAPAHITFVPDAAQARRVVGLLAEQQWIDRAAQVPFRHPPSWE